MNKSIIAGNTADTLRGVDRDQAVLVNKDILNIDSTSFQQFKEEIGFKNLEEVIANVVAEGLPSAEDLDEVAKELEITEATKKAIEDDPELQAELGASKTCTEYVTREDFDTLLVRIDSFNKRSGHHI